MSLSEPLDRTVPPKAEPPRPYKFPEVTSIHLSNGLRVMSARTTEFPLMATQLLSRAGSAMNPVEFPGLADLHAGLLEEGTESYSRAELAEAVEQLGGASDSGAGWNVSFTEMDLLSSSFDQGFELLAEISLRPSFDSESFERLKERVSTDLIRRKSRPRFVADDCFVGEIYPGSAYGFPLKGTAESLDKLDLDKVLDFRRRCFVPDGSVLTVVGDFETEAVHRRAEELFGGWQGGPAPELPTVEPRILSTTEVHVVDRPGSAQTQLQLGHEGPSRAYPEFYKLIALNVLLGGKFTSRLNLNLREKHGFTYGVQSTFNRRLGPAPFTIRTAVETDVAGAAVHEILFEVKRIQEERVPDQEWEETLSYLLGVFPYTVQTVSDLAGRLENLAIFGLPLEYYEIYPKQLRSMTSEQLGEAARQFLHPDRMVIVAAGPAETLVPQFEKFGEVKVHSA